jgi:colicin import membrane protein
MKTASAISTALHAGVLLWALVSFSSKTFEVTPAESLPVDLVTADQFSKMMKGAKDAPKKEEPAALVEKKKEEAKPVEEPKPKLTEKKEVPTPPAPPPEAAPPKPDAIADQLKKPEPPKEEAKAQPNPLPPKKPTKDQPKFDADKIAALLDKRDPQRNVATGEMPNSAPSLGASSGNDKRLSQSELDALRARLMALWNPPIGAQDVERLQITIRIRFKRDGTLANGPQVITSGSGARFNAMRDSAARAILVGQPYTMLRPENYDTWQEIEFTFDTNEMFHDIPVR